MPSGIKGGVFWLRRLLAWDFALFLNSTFAGFESARCSSNPFSSNQRIRCVLVWPIFNFKEQGEYSQIQDLLQKRIKSVLFWAFFGIQEYMACSQI